MGFESGPARGTQFIGELPLGLEPGLRDFLMWPSIPEIEFMNKLRVLVVDDYPDAAETACTLLSILGHECRFAMSGKDALIEAARFEPDVAILDIGLPDLSGFDLARELRKQFVGRPLFLAAVTGWGQPEDRAKALAAGFDHHVLKPADRSKLIAIMELAGGERASGIPSGAAGRA